MRLVRKKPYLVTRELGERVIITRSVSELVKRSVVTEEAVEYNGTILGDDTNTRGGAIPIPTNFDIINLKTAQHRTGRPWITFRQGLDNVRKLLGKYITNASSDMYIPVPSGISSPYTTDCGEDVMTNVQRRYDDMVVYYQEWIARNKKYSKYSELEWTRGYNRLLDEIAGILIRKGGYIDRAIGCLWKYSMRGVIVPDPSLNIDEIELPKKVIMSWLSQKEFREAYGIPEDVSMRDAVRMMSGRRVMTGRQPSHRMSNLMSFKLRIR